MKKTNALKQWIWLVIWLSFGLCAAHAQIVTTVPAVPDFEKEVTLIFDLKQAKGWTAEGLLRESELYLWSGADSQMDGSGFEFRPADQGWFGKPNPSGKLSALGNHRWQIKLIPRAHCRVPANKPIQQMALIVKSGDGTYQTENIYLQVAAGKLTIKTNLDIAPLKTKTQAVTLPASAVHKLKSKALNGEEYELLVGLPKGYDPKKKYPVVYVLDGDDLFALAQKMLWITAGECRFTEPILVGLSANGLMHEARNKRNRDYSLKVMARNGQSGAANFLTNLETEAIPFIEANYSTSPERILYGYSMGGRFAAYVLFQRPTLFQKFIIGSSWLMDEGVIVQTMEPGYAKMNKDLPAQVLLTAGSLESQAKKGNEEFLKLMQGRQYPNLKITTITLDGFNHGTAIPVTLLRGLQWAFCPSM